MVLQKIFKKFLFDRVQTYQGKVKEWGQAEWYNFFIIARFERSEGPSSYWDDTMREDCKKALRKEIKDFRDDI